MEYPIVDRLQVIGRDILEEELNYAKGIRVLVSKEFTFDSAHHLHCYEGKCRTLHGHSYLVVIGISGYTDSRGIATDFGDIKRIYQDCIHSRLDHKYLNEVLPPMNTTAENMVIWMFREIEKEVSKLPKDQGFRTEFVRLYETATSFAEVQREWIHRSVSID